MKRLLLAALSLCVASAGAADSAMSNFVADGVKAWYYNSHVIDNAHGRLFRLSADVTAVGDGATTLSLWIGHDNATLAKVEERAVTATGTQTFEYTSPRGMGDWEYFRIKMEQTVGGATTETWLPALNDSKNWAYLADGQVYEWTGGDSGGAWEDAANWRSTGEVDFVGTPTGYPASESVGGAVFPAGTNVVTIGSRKVVPFFRIPDGTALALRSATGRQEIEIGAWTGAGFAGLASFAVDGVDVFWSPEIGPTRADAVFSVTNGGHWARRWSWASSGAALSAASSTSRGPSPSRASTATGSPTRPARGARPDCAATPRRSSSRATRASAARKGPMERSSSSSPPAAGRNPLCVARRAERRPSPRPTGAAATSSSPSRRTAPRRRRTA